MKCFTLHVMNLKYMKVSLFEISYKKKLYTTFLRHSNLLRCTCIRYHCLFAGKTNPPFFSFFFSGGDWWRVGLIKIFFWLCEPFGRLVLRWSGSVTDHHNFLLLNQTYVLGNVWPELFFVYEWMNEWCIYIALYCVLLYTQSALQSCGGGLLNHHQCVASTWMMRRQPQDNGASALTTHQLQVERRER